MLSISLNIPFIQLASEAILVYKKYSDTNIKITITIKKTPFFILNAKYIGKYPNNISSSINECDFENEILFITFIKHKAVCFNQLIK